MPTAIIVGAGLAGLTAARVLADAGWRVRVVDKGKVSGGRLINADSRWSNGRTRCVDIGGQFLTARDPTFAATVADWEQRGWVRRWCDGIPVLGPSGLVDGRDGFPRWVSKEGMGSIARRLAEGLDLRADLTVTAVRPHGGGWAVTMVSGDATVPGAASVPQIVECVDAVLLTPPAPQVAALLTVSQLALPAGLTDVRFVPCVALVMDVPSAPAALLPESGAVRIDDPASPLSWVASARGRGQLSTGDALVLHFGAQWSAEHLSDHESGIYAKMRVAAAATLVRLGIELPFQIGEVFHRQWQHSRCDIPSPQPFLRVAESPLLLIAGDGFGACPRVEGAWLSGMAAAHALIAG